jgi:hypothetical protein
MLTTLCAVLATVALAPVAYAQSFTPPRLADGKTPDFRGIWNVVERKAGQNLEAGGTIHSPANGKIPYKPEARKLQIANAKDKKNLDPLKKCFQGGVPRSTMSLMPMQFVQGEGGYLALIHQENHAFQFFYPDSRPHYEAIDAWMGDSRYRWEGDTLVASNKSQSPTWLDDNGNHHTNQMEVIERYTMTDANTIRYEATVTDPEVFTGPWSFRLTLKRDTTPGAALVEDECIPDEHGVRYHVDPTKPEALMKTNSRRWSLIPDKK